MRTDSERHVEKVVRKASANVTAEVTRDVDIQERVRDSILLRALPKVC